MSDLEEILEKIKRGDILKLKEVEKVLNTWGYIRKPGKGSHQNWKHPHLPKILTIATHGKEVPRYIARELRKLLEEK